MKARTGLTILALLLVGYFAFSYNIFYWFIGAKHLTSPYKENTLTLENPQKEGFTKYVALGDSLTAGLGSNDVHKTMVYQYAQQLSTAHGKVDVINLGQPGATTVDLINSQLQPAIETNPNYITLLIGVNDIHANYAVSKYKTNLNYILQELLTKTSAKVVLINLPYLGSRKLTHFPLNIILDSRTKQFNRVVELLAQDRNRIKLVDLYTGTRLSFSHNNSLYSADLFHPSEAGYMLWSTIINAD